MKSPKRVLSLYSTQSQQSLAFLRLHCSLVLLVHVSLEVTQALILFRTERAFSLVPLLPMHGRLAVPLQCTLVKKSLPTAACASPHSVRVEHQPLPPLLVSFLLVVGVFYAHLLLGFALAPCPLCPIEARDTYSRDPGFAPVTVGPSACEEETPCGTTSVSMLSPCPSLDFIFARFGVPLTGSSWGSPL